MLWLFTILAGSVGLIYGIIKYIHGNDSYWERHGIEGIKSGDVSSLWEQLTFRLGFKEIDEMCYKELKRRDKNLKVGGIMEIRKPVLFLLDLDLIKAITVKDFDYFHLRRDIPFPKSDPTNFSKSLPFLENQEWKDTRSTLTPTFTTGKIRRMYGIFKQSANQMIEYLGAQIGNTGWTDIEMKEVCGRYTMSVIFSAAFGIKTNVFKEKDSIFYQMGQRIQNQFKGIKMLKFLIFILFPKLNEWAGITFVDSKAGRFFRDVFKKTLKQRVESGEIREDFVQLLLESRTENYLSSKDLEDDVASDPFGPEAQLKKSGKVYLDEDMLLAQSIIFFLAGFEAVESLLIFSVYELALNPDAQEKLAAEIKEAAQKNNGELSYDIINTLPYLDMVISEVLRKNPPALRFERRCAKDYKLPDHNYTVRKGDLVVIPTYGIHYDKDYFPNPEKFDPMRFSPENKALRNPYAYSPFGLGPRNCIGMRFALSQGKAAIAELVQSFIFAPTGKTSIPMVYTKSIEVKPANGMWLKLKKRIN